MHSRLKSVPSYHLRIETVVGVTGCARPYLGPAVNPAGRWPISTPELSVFLGPSKANPLSISLKRMKRKHTRIILAGAKCRRAPPCEPGKKGLDMVVASNERVHGLMPDERFKH